MAICAAKAAFFPVLLQQLLAVVLPLQLLHVIQVVNSSPSLSPHDIYLKMQASVLASVKQSFKSYDPSLNTWNVSSYQLLCSSWTGVGCDPHNRSVISIDISNSNIIGSLSPAITHLPSLASLTLSGNSFSGEFPREIHGLSKLQLLNASDNLFSGELDWDFSMLKELQVLDIYDNNFNGSLPLGITQLPKLTHLDLGGNYFTGTIPPSYGSMDRLSYLSLKGNDLSGFIPPHLGNLTNLEQLYLGYYNEFDGGIPPELGKLINLFHLDLANCSLEGPIPPELGSLHKLDTLFLQTNELTGSIPPQLGNLSSISSLDLSDNGLTGDIPAEFSALQELTLLNLFLNKLHGGIPQFIADLPKLEVLKLWHNNLTGTIPAKLGENGRLIELDLSSNKLTGLVPKSLCFGRKLKILILRFNFLSGPLPEDLGNCDTLLRVRMGQNYLNGSIPKGFLYLPGLSLVELQNNYLSGSIPDQASSTPSKLEQMNLSENRLSGFLPASVGNMSNLQNLLLGGNKLSGEIPHEIGRLNNVLTLDMSRNNFSGMIPPEIGNCPMLTYFDLSQNNLSGPVPLQITQLHVLNYLNVSSNKLSQSLPKEIGSMKSLTSADFSHNNFSGSVPDYGQYSLFNSTSFVGNPQLCGYFSRPCSSAVSPSQVHDRNGSSSSVPGKFKLLFALGLLACSLVFAVVAIIKTQKLRRSCSNSWRLTPFQKLEFGSEEILECIKETNIIGRGGAGTVYRGVMPNGEQVAVKKLLGVNKGSSHQDNGLSAEVQTLGRIRHRNIVRLLAFCSNKDTNLLVYEYMAQGSLGEVLHGKRGGYLRWETRLKIAIEAARGLSYLHHDCSPLIVHRDVKSNNILLNSDFEAHVADFGLAKFLLHDAATSQYMSAIAGSYGYIAPEYAYTLKVDEKSDVYSFGVVLLELITGKRPVGDFGEEGIDIVQWTKMQTNLIKEKVIKILDPRLNEVPLSEAMQVFFVAMLCVQEHSVERPTMRDVVQMLLQAKQPNAFYMQ